MKSGVLLHMGAIYLLSERQIKYSSISELQQGKFFDSDELELEFAEFEAGIHFLFKKAVHPALTRKDLYQTLAWYLAVLSWN